MARILGMSIRSRRLLQTFIVLILIVLFINSPTQLELLSLGLFRPSLGSLLIDDAHPISFLIRQAQGQREYLLSREVKSVRKAARAYREHRGRHPPPGFDRWFRYAREQNAVVVEDFFDQIYHDLTPFWCVTAKTVREQGKAYEYTISVRQGNATISSNGVNEPWMLQWHSMIAMLAQNLPDFDMPMNVMEEPRLVVPWEKIYDYMDYDQRARRMASPNDVATAYSGLERLDYDRPEYFDYTWHTAGPYWNILREGCAPYSAGGMSATLDDSGRVPQIPSEFPMFSFSGYVQNWTRSRDLCERPDIRALHGNLIEPLHISTTHQIIPLFGSSKLSMNNDILLPPAIYWTDNDQHQGESQSVRPWREKDDLFSWQGSATGGRANDSNWGRFHRHRLVAMTKTTAVVHDETSKMSLEEGQLPVNEQYHLKAQGGGQISDWLTSITNVSFSRLNCAEEDDDHTCSGPNLDQYDEIEPPVSSLYSAKYVADVDGNSFSGRFLDLLRSTSLPIKATIYSQWHDSRLIPWLHFVPMDNTFADLYGILDYFLGYKGVGSHDAAGQQLAMEGKKWAERVLRKEDMLIYVYRLLLEYARVCDDEREQMGSVGDLV